MNKLKNGIKKSKDKKANIKKSRDFVERWHDPLKIAERIKNDIENALKK